MTTYKIYALHSQTGQYYESGHFIDINGKPCVPCYEMEVSQNDANKITELAEIFPKDLSFGWMCAPHFRDVLIWKDSNEKVLKTFLLCFSCDQYKFSEGETETVIVELSQENIYEESIEKLKFFLEILIKKPISHAQGMKF